VILRLGHTHKQWGNKGGGGGKDEGATVCDMGKTTGSVKEEMGGGLDRKKKRKSEPIGSRGVMPRKKASGVEKGQKKEQKKSQNRAGESKFQLRESQTQWSELVAETRCGRGGKVGLVGEGKKFRGAATAP